MTDVTLQVELKELSDKEFFSALENYVKFKIPTIIPNILIFNGYNTAIALSTFDADSIDEIEQFMRNGFIKEMLDPTEKIEDYLGNFVNFPSQFTMLSGHKRLIKELSKACQQLYKEAPMPDEITTKDPRFNAENAKSILSQLSNSLFLWIRGQESVLEITDAETNIKIKRNTYIEHKDGSISVYVYCPYHNCKDGRYVTRKGYKSYYKLKRVVQDNGTTIRSTPPKWQLASIQLHIKCKHIDTARTPSANRTVSPSPTGSSAPSGSPSRIISQTRTSRTVSVTSTTRVTRNTLLTTEPPMSTSPITNHAVVTESSRSQRSSSSSLRRRKNESTIDTLNSIRTKRVRRVAK